MSKPSDQHPAAPIEGVMMPTNHRQKIDEVESTILAALDAMGYPDASRFAMRVALEEAMVNAFLHGHRGMSDDTPIRVEYRVRPEQVWVAVSDQGTGYDPHAVPDPTDEGNLELPSGRGLMLIKAFMTSVAHEDNGRRIVMTYDRPTE